MAGRFAFLCAPRRPARDNQAERHAEAAPMADRLFGRLSRFPPADLAAEPDAALLDRFAASPDDAPFAELVRRHGPMVLGVCRRVLGRHADAEDAFQAAFLVLARKAAAVRGRPVGGWLCRVAGNVARRHRDRDRRRTRYEQRAAAAHPVAVDHTPADDLDAILDDELGRLPDCERAAVVSCLVEGRTQADAARELGWSFGTLRRRLDRGKELLRARLTRRGVTVPVGFVGVAFVESVPPALADLTRVGAVGFARGVKTAAPAVTLAEGVLTMMGRTKLAAVTGVAVVAAGLTVGTGWALQQPLPGLPARQPVPGNELPVGQPPVGSGKEVPPGTNPRGGNFTVKMGDGISPHRIQPGDRLKIGVAGAFETAPIDGVYTVEPTGHVSLGPTYGRVNILGNTFTEAESGITNHLKQYLRNPAVMVTEADPPADQAVGARLAGLEARVKMLEEEVARLKGAPARPSTGLQRQ